MPNKKTIADLARRIREDPRRRQIGPRAAAGAYYFFLSLGPMAALLLSLLPYAGGAARLEELLAQAPAGFRQLFRSVAADVYAASPAALGLSALLELWSGAKFLAGAAGGAAAVWGTRRSFWRTRLIGAAATGGLTLLLLGDMALRLFGERLLYGLTPGHPGEAAVRGLLGLRPLCLMAGLTAGNVLLFRWASGGRGVRRQMPGALLAAGGWLLFSRLYSWALETFGLFGVYGSIAAAAATLYWVYGSLYILLLGAWINALGLWS